MPRLELTRGLTFDTAGIRFQRGRAVEVANEGTYNRLMRTGRFSDPEKRWTSINPRKMLPRVRPGSEVLVVRDMGLGDVLMVGIVLRALAKKWPKLKFVYATSGVYVDLFRDCTFLERVVPIADCNGNFANTIELRGYSERAELRRSMDRIDLFAHYCDVKLEDYSIPLSIRQDERAAGERLVGLRSRRERPPLMVLAVRGSTRVRSWPREHLDRFATMAADSGWLVVLVDHEHFPDLPAHPSIRNKTAQLNVGQLACVTAAADMVVAPDTGVVHLAEAVGTKCLAIYSTTPPALRTVHYRNVKTVWRKELPCAPCWDRGCAAIPCLTGVTPEHVLACVDAWDELPQDHSPSMGVPCTASV